MSSPTAETVVKQTAVVRPTLRVRRARFARAHPMLWMLASRLVIGAFTIVAVAAIVYFATTVLPGNAAVATLGQNATPERVAALEKRLHLDEPVLTRFSGWVTLAVQGRFGTSLVNGKDVVEYVAPKLVNSAVLVAITSVIAAIVGLGSGALAALRRDKPVDHVTSVAALVASSLPEYVVAVFMVILFAVNVFQWFPAVSVLPPGTWPWEQPEKLVLPVLSLLIVVVPYIMRMTRAATIEALESEYVQMARLKGAPGWRVVMLHAFPNALAPAIQVVALNVLYLAGGIVLIEMVFAYPGIGAALVSAVLTRDIPVVQFIALVLALVYVIVNIVTDALVLLVTPRRRLPR